MNTPPPMVSVIVPVYENPAGIDQVLKALRLQSYPADRYEVIIADNGSQDETVTTAEAHARDIQAAVAAGPRVHIVVEQTIQSSYAARNKGLEVAGGEIVAFTDSDCVPSPGWIEAGVRALSAGADLAAGDVRMTISGATPNLWEHLDASRKLNQKSYVDNAGFGATANLFVRRAAIDAHGEFRSDLQSGGDYEFGRRLTQAGCGLVFSADAWIEHPARSSFEEIWKKTRRVARGQRQLQKLGLLQHGRLAWRSFAPLRRTPVIEANGHRPALPVRVAALVIANVLHYSNLYWRLA